MHIVSWYVLNYPSLQKALNSSDFSALEGSCSYTRAVAATFDLCGQPILLSIARIKLSERSVSFDVQI